MWDDIPIPEPRKANRWYCSICGEPTGEPEPGYELMDPRYAIGHCPCSPGRRNRVSGFRHPLINLIADFEWDREAWLRRQREHADMLAFQRQQAGMTLKPEDLAAAARYRARLGLPLD